MRGGCTAKYIVMFDAGLRGARGVLIMCESAAPSTRWVSPRVLIV